MEPTSTDRGVAAPIPIGSGAPCHSNRMFPCVPGENLIAPAPGVATSSITNDKEEDFPQGKRPRSTRNPSVAEGVRLLAMHGFETHRPTERVTPVDIVALKGDEILKIAVIRSRKPVQDARTLHQLFPARLKEICAFSRPYQYATMVWVISPIVGWRYYKAGPGGIWRDWQFTRMMED